jgi:hypothetical protein
MTPLPVPDGRALPQRASIAHRGRPVEGEGWMVHGSAQPSIGSAGTIADTPSWRRSRRSSPQAYRCTDRPIRPAADSAGRIITTRTSS